MLALPPREEKRCASENGNKRRKRDSRRNTTLLIKAFGFYDEIMTYKEATEIFAFIK